VFRSTLRCPRNANRHHLRGIRHENQIHHPHCNGNRPVADAIGAGGSVMVVMLARGGIITPTEISVFAMVYALLVTRWSTAICRCASCCKAC